MKDQTVVVAGSVRDIFAHRFVLRTEAGAILADLGPEGAADVGLAVGDEIEIEGERKPSEIKVSRLSRGGRNFDLAKPKHGKGGTHDDSEDPADPAAALRATREAGLTPIGEPRRKHRHFEVLARDASGRLVELHVDLDGREMKRKLVEEADDKWSVEIKDEP